MRSAIRPARLFLAALSLAGLASCGDNRAGPIRVVAIGDPPEIADPSQAALGPADSILIANVAQGLVRFDARGQIVPGLAERWNVTDDGLSYIFRIASAEWAGGGKVTAQQVARALKRQITSASNNALKDSVGAIDEIVAMTDRVIEIRLRAPRPNLLQLLAQPEFALIRNGSGTGPFEARPVEKGGRDVAVALVRTVSDPDLDESEEEEVLLSAAAAPRAVRLFLDGQADLVLGGTFANLPYARTPGIAGNALQFDPAAGLFGLIPDKTTGPMADVEFRRMLSRAIDREAVIKTLNVPSLLPRATILEPGLDGNLEVTPPEWMTVPMAQRRIQAEEAAERYFAGSEERPTLSIALPDGPGSQLLLNQLSADLAVLGVKLVRAREGERADLTVIDRVAPSTSPSWFVRQFRCDLVRICDADAQSLLDAARAATVPAQRYALLNEAARTMDEAQLFIPLAAPIRWSLVSSRAQGFAPNRFARHTLAGIGRKLAQERLD